MNIKSFFSLVIICGAILVSGCSRESAALEEFKNSKAGQEVNQCVGANGSVSWKIFKPSETENAEVRVIEANLTKGTGNFEIQWLYNLSTKVSEIKFAGKPGEKTSLLTTGFGLGLFCLSSPETGKSAKTAGAQNKSDRLVFMNGKYKLGHQISPDTSDPDERLMKDDIANQLTPTNEKQFWAKQNWNDNVIRNDRSDIVLMRWEGELTDALKMVDQNNNKLKDENLQELGAPVYWIAMSKLYYNMSGKFRVGFVMNERSMKKNGISVEQTLNKLNSQFESLKSPSELEPLVEFGSLDAKTLLAIRGNSTKFDYLK